MTDTTNKTPTEILAPDVVTPEVVPAQAPKQGKQSEHYAKSHNRLAGVTHGPSRERLSDDLRGIDGPLGIEDRRLRDEAFGLT